ncbi:glycosyltransferase family 2 protein [Turicibacter sanguinis]|uniref:glycosyltransferase family 2 protein n=1 Tax=Turicibacter sanguinis TaxID=154288 RepID=UPI0018AC8D73|nr:glycosyltransferase family A protein [Turicibacter sanguinis]
MISVIIPVYNSEHTIETAINSILRQTLKCEIEIIVINDGSTDSSLKLIKKIKQDLNDDNVNLIIIDKKNGGVSSARNAGLKKASKKYIALLDADDEWKEEKLEKQLNILEKNENISFIGCNRNNDNINGIFKKINSLSRLTTIDLLIKMRPQTSTVVFRRTILKEVGFYDENQKYAEDGNYWFKILEKNNIYIIPESLVITGNNKPSYGYSGLSANLIEMHNGEMKNIQELVKRNQINYIQYIFFILYLKLKYFRRIFIVKRRRKNAI